MQCCVLFLFSVIWTWSNCVARCFFRESENSVPNLLIVLFFLLNF